MGKKIASSNSQIDLSRITRIRSRSKLETYASFDEINGQHPWQDSVPDGYVLYPVRRLQRGKVAYFNFQLAREMGLIPNDHPDQMNPALAEKILDTFAIQIINEYDQQNGTRFPKGSIKPHPHMATRYLQLQHVNKQGKTSGDGRSVWNGVWKNQNGVWDISSRGTGVTCLSPGAVEANRPLKTGAAEYGYGCGLADISELFGSAVMSEIFHQNGVQTERMLTIIDLGKGCGIGVRAAPNLIRPAHLFLYLKQKKLDSLREATDYLIRRQTANGQWKISATATNRYQSMLREIALSFARFAAHLERNYIFAWLDWDGDNVLASAGIIDYGSIRQFGLRHDQYRYDDVQRFSTNLNEQRGKARLTVQVFAQLVSYLETGKHRPLEDFTDHASVREYDREFDVHLRLVFLKQIGFDDRQIQRLLSKNKAAVEKLYGSFLTLEKTKTKAGIKKVADGINRPAVFNMRAALRELPSLLLNEASDWSHPCPLHERDLLALISSSYAKKTDLRLKGALRQRLQAFQKNYVQLLKVACGDHTRPTFLKSLAERAEDTNRIGRITGNGAEFIVEEILKARRRGLTHEEVQAAMDLFIASQSPKSSRSSLRFKPQSLQSDVGQLFQQLVHIAHEWEEDI